MARYCGACGRSMDEHEAGEKVLVIASRGRGRLRVRRQKQYGCKVRLAATASDGRTIVPNSPQRLPDTDTGYRHESRFT